jgi:hypothetical protein
MSAPLQISKNEAIVLEILRHNGHLEMTARRLTASMKKRKMFSTGRRDVSEEYPRLIRSMLDKRLIVLGPEMGLLAYDHDRPVQEEVPPGVGPVTMDKIAQVIGVMPTWQRLDVLMALATTASGKRPDSDTFIQQACLLFGLSEGDAYIATERFYRPENTN